LKKNIQGDKIVRLIDINVIKKRTGIKSTKCVRDSYLDNGVEQSYFEGQQKITFKGIIYL